MSALSTLPAVDFAVRLADEGVPVRAIARAICTPTEDLRQQLCEAQQTGRLLTLPRDDWPPGFPRDQRALQLSRLVVEDKTVLLRAVQYIFKLTPIEAQLLLDLVQHPNISKDRLYMTARTVYVHIHFLRKRLTPFNIEIATLWGYGFQLSSEHRYRVMDIILQRVAAPVDP